MNFVQYLNHGDIISKTVAILMLCMSIISWIVIVVKFWTLRRANGDVQKSTNAFWQATSLEEGKTRVKSFDRENLVNPLITACQNQPEGTLAQAGQLTARLTRVLRESLHQGLRKLHWGQVVLATIGSTAPFVGLLGTVWGIFNALTGIAGASQVSLDQVAGPVGEALIMTAAGLAVAIPAVLAYNLFGRQIGRIEADLEGFAADLRALFTDPTQQLCANENSANDAPTQYIP